MIPWLSPGDPAQRTGGYLYNARMARALGDVRLVDVRTAADVPDAPRYVADGLLWPRIATPALAARTVVVVHSLQVHEGGDDRAERRSWEGVRALVATSALTAGEIGRPAHVVIPGTAPAPPARGGGGILTVGTITPRKGHDRLLAAFAGCRGWTLRCAGAARDPAWAAALPSDPRVTWLGDLDDDALAAEYDRADLVVQAARYEAFGMAIAEAVARGLPVLTAPAGVIEHLPPGAVAVTRDLAADLPRWLSDPAGRAALAARARAARLPDWPEQAACLRAFL